MESIETELPERALHAEEVGVVLGLARPLLLVGLVLGHLPEPLLLGIHLLPQDV